MVALILALLACPTEDSSWCYWDGGPNGQGRGFIALQERVIYLP